MKVNGLYSKSLVFGVALGDLIWMNALLAVLYVIWPRFGMGPVFNGSYWELMTFNTLCYAICTYHNGMVLHFRKKRNIRIVGKVMTNCLKFASISLAFIVLAGYEGISTRFFVLFHVLNFLVLILWRIGCYKLLKAVRSRGRNSLSCIYLGSGKNIRELHKEMKEPTLGYRICGYFDFEPNETLEGKMEYLGTPDQAVAWMEKHPVHQVYCGLHSAEGELILSVIQWCERNFTRFYSVPNVRNYLHRRMWYS